MIDILNVIGEPIFDDRIVKIETHTYNRYVNSTFGHSDEIRIVTRYGYSYSSRICTCSRATVFFYIEGRLPVKKKNDQMTTTLENNCVAFMFDEIRYEFNDVKIDHNRNVGIISIIKNYVSMMYKVCPERKMEL